MPPDTGRIYEAMRRTSISSMGGTTVLRLWIRIPEMLVGSDAAVALAAGAQQEASLIVRGMVGTNHPSLIVKRIADEVDGINAVELLDGHGNGFLAYNDWP